MRHRKHAVGVRGLRINVLFGGGIGFAAMEMLAHRIKVLGWHMEFLLDVKALPELIPRMRKLPITGVIDHMGHTPVAAGLSSPGFAALRELVVGHGYWVKLSGAYPCFTALARGLGSVQAQDRASSSVV